MRYLSKVKKRDLAGKTVLVRAGFDLLNEDFEVLKGRVPLRIASLLPTLHFLIQAKAKIVLLSHRGRPTPRNGGTRRFSKEIGLPKSERERFSLRPFATILGKLLKRPVSFIDFRLPIDDFITHAHVAIEEGSAGSLFLLENLRFFKEETQSSSSFGKKLARLGDAYVNDSFSMDHRNNASVDDIPNFLPSYAGFSLEEEIRHLSRARRSPARPLLIIIGGAKISDKMILIKKILPMAQFLLTGGGIANTFNAALGIPMGDSLYEKDMIPVARQLLRSGKIILPIDFVRERKKILDIGPKTTEEYRTLIKKAKTIIWNGPLGYVSNPRFRKGSEAVANAILRSKAFAVVGGGETVSFFQMVKSYERDRKKKRHVFLSTGGGALLKFLAGERLPGIDALR